MFELQKITLVSVVFAVLAAGCGDSSVSRPGTGENIVSLPDTGGSNVEIDPSPSLIDQTKIFDTPVAFASDPGFGGFSMALGPPKLSIYSENSYTYKVFGTIDTLPSDGIAKFQVLARLWSADGERVGPRTFMGVPDTQIDKSGAFEFSFTVTPNEHTVVFNEISEGGAEFVDLALKINGDGKGYSALTITGWNLKENKASTQ